MRKVHMHEKSISFMGGRFPGGQFRRGGGGSFPGGRFPGGSFLKGQFSGGSFPGGSFPGGGGAVFLIPSLWYGILRMALGTCSRKNRAKPFHLMGNGHN